MLSLHSSAFQQESRLYLFSIKWSELFRFKGFSPTYSYRPYSYRGFYLVIWIVVEPFSIRDLAADCPILIILKHSHLIMFQIYVVVYKALRSFQQFNGFFFIWITPYRNYYVNPIIFSQSISYIH